MFFKLFGYGVILEVRPYFCSRLMIYRARDYCELRWFKLAVSFGRL